MELTPTEERIQERLKGHPQINHLRSLTEQIKQLMLLLNLKGAQQDILAVAAVTHLTGMLAAQKMAGMVDSDLIDLLLDDLVDTVRNRAIAGEMQLRTKQ